MAFKPSALPRRTPIRRKVPLSRKSRLRPVSPKRRLEAPERTRVVRRVLERDVLCRARVSTECTAMLPREAVDVHEILPRSRGGDYLDPAECIGVCRFCHDWLHAHPKAARALGLIR